MKQRTIEFRAWDGTKMHTHDELDKFDSDGIIHIMDIIKPNNPDKMIVTMWTGLHDRNGKKIFEGDVVRSKSHSPENYNIEFIEGGFCATNPAIEGYPIDINHFYPSTGCDIEVIGNVFEHPNLLQ